MCEVFVKQDPRRYVQVTRRVRLNGQTTSIRIEAAFWDIISEMARRESVTTGAFLSTLHSEVLLHHGEPTNFTSLLRCTCLLFLERTGGNSDHAPAPPDHHALHKPLPRRL